MDTRLKFRPPNALTLWTSLIQATRKTGFVFILMASPILAKTTFANETLPHEVKHLHVNGYLNAVSWNEDGSKLASLGNFGGHVALWETKTWNVLKEFDRYGGAYSFNSLGFLPDGTLLTVTPVGNYSKDPRFANTPLTDPKYDDLGIFSLVVWNPDLGKTIRYIPDLGYPPKDTSNKGINTFSISRDGSLIACIHGGGVLIYEASSGLLQKNLIIPVDPGKKTFTESLAFSPDGKELAVGTIDGKIYFFDPQSGVLMRSYVACPQAEYPDVYSVGALAYNSDGSLIAAAKNQGLNLPVSNDISVDILRVNDGTTVASLAGSVEELNGVKQAVIVHSLAWDPNGDVLAIGDEASFHLWHVTEAAQNQILTKSVSNGAFCVAFSPDHRLAVATSNSIFIYQF